jgi:opacity protein-like surface antigen
MSFARTVASLALLGLSSGAFAADAVKAANNQISLSFGREKVSYTETYDNVWMDSENGHLDQARLSYMLQGDIGPVSDVYFQSVFGYAKGKTKYDGALNYWDGASWSSVPYQSTTRVTNSDVSLKIGKGFSIGNRVQLTPFLGYDYHQWKRDLGPADLGGYKEVYDHHAVSVGLLGQAAITDKLVASAWASRGRMIRARMEVEDDTTFRLKARHVTSWGLGLDYRVSGNIRVNAGYQWSKFRYGESNEIDGFLEPDSETTLKSYYMGAGYAF